MVIEHDADRGCDESLTAKRMGAVAFAAAWLFVIGSSVYDGYWVLANRQLIPVVERNPLGRLLIHWNGNDIWLLLAVKAVGTLCAGSILLLVYWNKPRLGWVVCLAAVTTQLLVMFWLQA